AYWSSFNSVMSLSRSNTSLPVRAVCVPSGDEIQTDCSEPAVPQTMLSPSAVPHTMLSPSAEVPHTMLSPSAAVPPTMLSPSPAVPHTMLSPSVAVPHTMLSPSAVLATPHVVLVWNAFAVSFNTPCDSMWLPQMRCLLHIACVGTVSPG